MSSITHQLESFCHYSLTFKGNTERAVHSLRYEVGHFIQETKLLSLEQITRPLIEGYVMTGKLERNWSAKTIRNRLVSIRVFLDWGVKQELIADNPARKVDLPRLPKKLPTHLSKEEALKVLDWARHYPYLHEGERTRAVAIIALLIFTGLRHQELLNLKLQDVRLEQNEVFVRSGKGKKDRLIPMTPNLAIILQNYLKDRCKRQTTCVSFFLSLKDDDPMGPKAIPRLVTKLKKASGIYFYPHMLRHTFATLMLEGGADIYAISKMMGHSQIQTTTIYLSATTQHLKTEINKHPLVL